MKNRLLVIIMFLAFALSTSAQMCIRDLWATASSSVVPVLTENNRLDMIDFIDNNMEARVRNIFEGWSTLDTMTDNYLRCTISAHTDVQMRLLPTGDSTYVVAVVNTSRTPAAVSTIRFYNTDWSEAQIKFNTPLAGHFVDSCDVQALRELADLPLVAIELSPDTPTAVCAISAQPLSRETRKQLENKLHPITLYWNEKTRSFVADSAVQ